MLGDQAGDDHLVGEGVVHAVPPVQRPGASVPVSTTSPEVVRVAEFAVAAQQNVIRAATGEASGRLGLIRIDAAELQVVAGIGERRIPIG